MASRTRAESPLPVTDPGWSEAALESGLLRPLPESP